ncbi:MAG: ABC transporter permease [Planctomycetota bacterium]
MLGVALGVAIVVAIHVMDHNTIRSRLLERQVDFGSVDLELVPLDASRDPTEVRRTLQAMTAVRDVGILHAGLVAVGQGDAVAATAQIYGLSPLPASAFGHYRVDVGVDLQDLDGDGSVLVGRDLADALHLSVGSTLRLRRPQATPHAACQGGRRVAVQDSDAPAPPPADVTVKGVLARERLGRRNLGFVVVSSFPLARRLVPTERSMFQLNRHSGSNVDSLRQELSQAFQVLDDRSALLGESADERAFRNGVKVLGCLALVLGMFVVFQTLSQSLVERLKQIGLLRCLGTSRRAVASIFLIDALATALLGALLGVFLGLGLAYLLQSLHVSTLGVGKRVDTFEIPLVPILWTAALGVLFTLAGAGFPLFKARNVSPLLVLHARGLGEDSGGAYVLRGVNTFLFVMLVLVLPGAYLAMTPLLSEEGRETLLVLGQLGAMLLLFGGVLLVAPGVVRRVGTLLLWPARAVLRLPSFLTQKALERSSGRFAASVCGLAVVLLALVALKHITYSLRGEVAAFGAVTMRDRLFLRCEQPITVARAAELGHIEHVLGVDAFEGRARQAPYELSGLDLGRLLQPGRPLVGAPGKAQAYEATRSVVVSERLADLRGLHPGDALSVLTDEGPKPYTVLAVSDAAGFFPDERAWAVAAPRWLRQDFCVEDRCVDRIALEMEPGADSGVVLAAVRQVLPQATWAKTGDWLVNYHTRDVTRDFFLFDVLLALILLLAGLGLVNAMTIAAMGRAREIGVLRALGMRRRALLQTYLLEGLLVGVLSTGIAWLAGLPLGAMVVAGLNRVAGLEAPVVVPWFWFALVPALALTIGVFAALLPASRVLRESPAESVRYE